MERYPREFRGPYFRLLPTAGVCDYYEGVSPRLLPTAGVCDRHVGATNRLLPTAGVCDHRVDVFPRLLPTAGVCDQHVAGQNGVVAFSIRHQGAKIFSAEGGKMGFLEIFDRF